MMRRRIMFVGALLLVCATMPSPAQNETRSNATAERLGAQLTSVNDSLERMVVLLESFVRQQEASLLLKRIELSEQRLTPLESRRRGAESAVTGAEASLGNLRNYLEQLQGSLREELRSGGDSPNSAMRAEILEVERAIEREEAQLDEARRRLRRAEDELSDRRQEIEDLDDQLLELLQSRSPKIRASP